MTQDTRLQTTIGVTDCSKYDNYANWINAYGKEVEVIKLSEKLQNFEDVKRCQGILFTGGEDVHPRFYNKPEYLVYCHKDDVSEVRDEFELKLLQYTEQNKVPVLGICRGLQIFNVFVGGTLIPDIPSWDKPSHAKLSDGSDRYHAVKLTSGSWLADTIGKTSGEINSNHHQAIERIGKGLVVAGVSEDDVIEAVERKDPESKEFLCLVQWHPERMNDPQSPFVFKIREAFIKAAQTFR